MVLGRANGVATSCTVSRQSGRNAYTKGVHAAVNWPYKSTVSSDLQPKRSVPQNAALKQPQQHLATDMQPSYASLAVVAE